MEIWKQSNLAPDYIVSSAGRVARQSSGRGAQQMKVLSQYVAKDGRPSVTLRVAGRTKTIRVCVLVADAFIGPKPHPRHEACHYDGDPANNHFANVRWDTRSANREDQRRHGTLPRGGSHSMAKLTEADIREIRRAFEAGEVQRLIGLRFGVSQAQVSRIIRGQRWASTD